MAVDPVCGMTIDEKYPPEKLEYKGKTYYFCSVDCRSNFQKDPEKYHRPDAGGHQHHHH